MKVRERTLKYELTLTAPEGVELDVVSWRIEWSMGRSKTIWKDGVDLVDVRLIEESEVQEMIK